MKRTLTIWRGLRPNSAAWITLVCALLMMLATAAYAKTFSGKKPQFDESKMGRYVLYPGIDEPVRLQGLELFTSTDPMYEEYRLPDDIVDKLIRARDRNAFWLICEARRDYSSIAYTYVFANNSGLATRINAVEGPYDRGVYFKVPSEYILYQCDLSKCQFRDEDGYFKVIMAPAPIPDEQPYSRSALPCYIKWASPIRVAYGGGWMNPRLLMIMDEFRTKEDFVNGAELWFDEKDLRLVKEIITEPTALEDGSGWDYSKAVPVAEVEYDYMQTVERDYPVTVKVLVGGHIALKMEFKMADGFWMLRKGSLYEYAPDEDNVPRLGFNTANIVVKR